MKYWHNKKNGQAVWIQEDKSIPISFKHCALNLLRWSKEASRVGSSSIDEQQLVSSVAQAVAASAERTL